MATAIRASILIGYPDLAREIGLDPRRMLDRVGIPGAALDDPDMRISATALRDLFELCGKAAEDWCLRLISRGPLAVAGPVLLIAREQPTLRDGLAAVYRYIGLHHEAVSHRCEEGGEVAIMRMVLTYETPGSSRQVAEGSLFQIMRFARLYLGPNWRPLSTHFMHARPASLDTHHRLFGREIFFDQDFHGLVIRRSDLDARNEAANPEMARLAIRLAEEARRGSDGDLTSRVREGIEGLLRSGDCHVATLARHMQLDPRTLQRHLARSNSSFGEVLQEARLDLARQLLEESDRPLAEVAERLGFSALSAFSRWHSRSCGQSPNARRDSLRGAAVRG